MFLQLGNSSSDELRALGNPTVPLLFRSKKHQHVIKNVDVKHAVSDGVGADMPLPRPSE